MEPGDTTEKRPAKDGVEELLQEEIRFWTGLIARDWSTESDDEVADRAWKALARAQQKLLQYRLSRQRHIN